MSSDVSGGRISAMRSQLTPPPCVMSPPILPAVNARIPDDDWVSARVEKARHEREIALAAARRLEDEVRRLTYRVAELESGCVAQKNRAQEAEAYIAAVKASLPWRIVQSLRGLVGRKW